MCFGRKEKQLYNDSDDAPRPAPGQFPAQPTYADPAPKASMPQQVQQPYYPPQVPSPVSPVSPQQYQSPTPYQPPPPARPSPAELSAVAQSNPPAELSSGDFAPPPGPPPSHRKDDSDYAPPPGPPPSHNAGNDFAPPPGPPPSHSRASADYTAPPPGPPPSTAKPVHDWEIAVPDTSLFPPPPAIFSGWYESPTSNATEEEAKKGEAWCDAYPLIAPLTLDAAALSILRTHSIRLMTPNTNFLGTLTCTAPGVWSGATDPKSRDSCILGYPPLYSVREHSPLGTGRTKTIYYEALVKGTSSSKNPFQSSSHQEDITLALGFTALPYPNFRMPGWHRGSLAVHGDDGHKFINDRWGGKSFTEPFRRGETYGIGMTFRAVDGGRIETEIFFTRQGRISGSWNLHEETDAKEDLPVTGLEGFHDLSVAVGTYQAVAFDLVFDPARWLYKPADI